MDTISSTIDLAMEFPYDERDTSSASRRVRASLSVLQDLRDRRGIKNGFCDVDLDVREEIVDTLATIIEQAMTMTKDEIRAILGDAVQDDGSLYGRFGEVDAWVEASGRKYAYVRGAMTADEFEAIAAHMRAHSKNPPPK